MLFAGVFGYAFRCCFFMCVVKKGRLMHMLRCLQHSAMPLNGLCHFFCIFVLCVLFAGSIVSRVTDCISCYCLPLRERGSLQHEHHASIAFVTLFDAIHCRSDQRVTGLAGCQCTSITKFADLPCVFVCVRGFMPHFLLSLLLLFMLAEPRQ